jgi:hypothetical protein
MTLKRILLLILGTIVVFLSMYAQKHSGYKTILSGIPWFDNNFKTVNAHGACIIKDNDRYYLFGEYKSDTSNAFSGFSCYSSTDLMNWKFENMVLPVQDSGKLGPNRVGERVKVLKCPKTGEYVMYMHTDNMAYKDQCIGYATSKTIDGIYKFKGALLYRDEPIRKWDMGVFQDSDGSGYLITHSGNLFKLSDDYKSVSNHLIKNMTGQCEAPAIFKKDSIYYWIGSGLTSWERNDNYYFTATSLEGPWTERGFIAPKGSLTWNSQSTFVLAVAGIKDTTYMYMGDRWSYPRQNSSATYVWQPIIMNGVSISLPDFKESWKIDASSGIWSPDTINRKIIDNSDTTLIKYLGKWNHLAISDTVTISCSDSANSSISLNFEGRQAGFYGFSNAESGYAQLIIKNSKGNVVISSMIDMYCKYPDLSLKFLSPILPKDTYNLTISVMKEHGTWSDKRKSVYGSTGYFVSMDNLILTE